MTGAASLNFELNGRPVQVAIPGQLRLSDVLRDRLGATGTKVGCDAGDCGACSVILNGEIVCACMVPVGRLEGSAVETIEGLGGRDGDAISRLQQSFLRHGAAQCGICTPGMLMSAAQLLKSISSPSRQQVEDALGGVLCRCTGYAKIVDAVLDAGSNEAGGTVSADGPAIGRRLERLDGPAKVSGHEIFSADDIPDDCLGARAIRSPFHHAGFVIGDTDRFIADHRGVEAIFTAHDVPGKNCFGVIPPFADQPVFAVDEARFKGEAVALIVGEMDVLAQLDLSQFPVTWSELPAVLTETEAGETDAPIVHASRSGNVLTRGLVQRGDVEAAMAVGDIVLERSCSTGFVEHAYIEPEAGYARRVDDRLEVFACTQAPHMDRDDLAGIMGLQPEQIRILPSVAGGGFGSKLDLSLQPFLAIAAWHLNQPVRMVYSRSESISTTTKRHPGTMTARAAATRDGKLTAIDFEGAFNTGAYASWGPTVANRVPVHASGPYMLENYRARSVALHTHCAPSGAFRGFGVPQAAATVEVLIDKLADAIGMDRLEFRLANVLRNGTPTVTGQVFDQGVGIAACLEALKPRWEEARMLCSETNARANGQPVRRGVGLAVGWYGCGNTSLPNPSTIKAGIDAGGTIWLHQGAVDIGQGSNTVIAQIFADALGIDVRAIRLKGADTDMTPDAGKTSASRQTFVTGNAARLTGEALRQQILRRGNVSGDAVITLEASALVLGDGNTETRIELGGLAVDDSGYVLMAEETYDPPTSPLDDNGQGEPYAQFGYAAHLVELTVDTALGTVKVDRITAAHDVGRAVNPLLIEGQVEGGIAQGLGMALMEEFIPGRTENLHDYLIPTVGDVPPIDTLIIEEADGEGPYGVKGLGEHALIPTAPAILNAIRDACGVEIDRLPATPDRVLAAIKSQEAAS